MGNYQFKQPFLKTGVMGNCELKEPILNNLNEDNSCGGNLTANLLLVSLSTIKITKTFE